MSISLSIFSGGDAVNASKALSNAGTKKGGAAAGRRMSNKGATTPSGAIGKDVKRGGKAKAKPTARKRK